MLWQATWQRIFWLAVQSERETETGNALLWTLNFRVHTIINKRGHAQATSQKVRWPRRYQVV